MHITKSLNQSLFSLKKEFKVFYSSKKSIIKEKNIEIINLNKHHFKHNKLTNQLIKVINQNLIKKFIENAFRVKNNIIVEFFINFKIQLLITFFTFDKFKQQKNRRNFIQFHENASKKFF